jgi:hypothetical protein
MEKEYRKWNDIFTSDAMVILPFVIISHEKEKFLKKIPWKSDDFLKTYYENNTFLENLSRKDGNFGKFTFFRKISME